MNILHSAIIMKTAIATANKLNITINIATPAPTAPKLFKKSVEVVDVTESVVKLYPLLKRKFGDIDVMIPNCYEDHLNKRYKDYKKDLPNEKRIGHVPYEINVPLYKNTKGEKECEKG